MTIVNRDYGCVFLKSRKTASSSVEIFLIKNTALGSDIYATSIEILDYDLPRSQSPRPLVPGQSGFWYTPSRIENRLCGRVRGLSRLLPRISQHDSAQRVRALVGKKFFDAATIVVPVRNPWDALVSYFHWDKSGGQGRKAPIQTTWPEWLAAKLRVDEQADHLCDAQRFLFYEHLKLEDQTLDAHLIFFENIESSLDELSTLLGIDIPKFENEEMHFKRSTRNPDYRCYYTQEDAERVSHIFSDYLAITGYRFDEVGTRPA